MPSKAIQYSTLGSLASCENLAKQWATAGKIGVVTRVAGGLQASQWEVETFIRAFRKDPDKYNGELELNRAFNVEVKPDSLDLGDVFIVFGKDSWLDIDRRGVCVGTPSRHKWTQYEDSAEAIREGAKEAIGFTSAI